MKVNELKNYGKAFVEVVNDPKTMKRVNNPTSKEFRREMRLITSIIAMWSVREEVIRMKNHEMSYATVQ